MRYSHYIGTTLRKLSQYKLYTFFNLVNMAIGTTCAVLVVLYDQYELSYDIQHEQVQQVFRITTTRDARTPTALAPAIREKIPEVMHAVRLRATSSTWFIKIEESSYYEDRIYVADESIFDVFTIPFLKGDPNTALMEPNSVVISETIARKYFGDDDPMGKSIQADDWILRITGVMEEISHSHLQSNMFVSNKGAIKGLMDGWYTNRVYTYIRLHPQTSVSLLEGKLDDLVEQNISEEFRSSYEFNIQPITSIHLTSHLLNELEYEVSYNNLIVLSVIGLLILIVACVNFINFTIALFAYRSTEIGLRKALGANRRMILEQYLVEIAVISIFVSLIVFSLLEGVLPIFEQLVKIDFALSWTDHLLLHTYVFLGLFLGGLVAYAYPVFMLSVMKPVSLLQGLYTVATHARFKKGSIFIQYMISVVLLVCTGVVYDQWLYEKDKQLGFKKENIIVIPRTLISTNSKSLMHVIRREPHVHSVATGNYVPGRAPGRGTFLSARIQALDESASRGQPYVTRVSYADSEYFESLGMEFAAGGPFKDSPLSPGNEVVLNETAVRQLGWSSPDAAIGKKISHFTINQLGWRNEQQFTIKGVIMDFRLTSVQHLIEPLLFRSWGIGVQEFMVVRFRPEMIESGLKVVENHWLSYSPNVPFIYSFLDDDIDQLYKSAEHLVEFFGTGAFFALALASMGLLKIISFMMMQRSREIGIRKVLGATEIDIMYLLSKEFLVLAFLANLIAWPIAYVMMQFWLQDYAYRLALGSELYVFVTASLLVLTITVAMVVVYCLKSSFSDPVATIRRY